MRGRVQSTLVALSLLVAVVFLAGCGRKTAGPTASDYQQKRAQLIAKRNGGEVDGVRVAMAQPTTTAAPLAGADAADYSYDPVGKRDPFRSFVLDRLREDSQEAKGPLEQFDLAQIEVLGVVWETDNARALVVDPSGQAYVVREGDAIGKNDGRVVGIGDNLMRVQETYVDYVGDRTTKEIEMRVRQSQGG